MRFQTALVIALSVVACSAAIAESGGMPGMHDNADKMVSQMQQCMTMMKNGLGPADKDYDKRFIDMMIPHHQGAVDMAKDAEKKAQHPQLKKLAQDIIKAQEKEIKEMQAWRTEWYGKQ